ncbi:hypothetical protein FH608_049405 [Nonomuraea phyllanthi]|uniref:Uncharacterized protein n=1 Tax=Nonomuraea phyllanthi TaxID=2219224 RepID=A0A5C4UXH0_9ACTN|nr:hypothetical protein [Nonomuraea phyllanthi]KAB8183274.1 hypothetical protein FH608_049405 [Nonomuraea phyllanthi]QFY12998.1 hypothetical protein GBF35_46350 [Nonomuraea phyllanthi]
MFGSIAGALAVFGLLAVVVGGLFSGTTLSVTGWPGDKPGGPGSTDVPDRPSPTATPRRTNGAKQPPAVATPTHAPSSSPTAVPRRTRSAVPTRARNQQEPLQAGATDPGKRPATEQPSADPGNSASTKPSSEPTSGGSTGPDPTVEPVPTEPDQPGRDVPPGHDPGKTRGPKG